MITALLLLCAEADAATAMNYLWPIRRDTAPGGLYAPVLTERLSLGAKDLAGCTEPTGTLATDWAYVTIESVALPGGGVAVDAVFTATVATWPSAAAWAAHTAVHASAAVCGETYNLTITITQRQDEIRAGGSWDQPAGWTPTTGVAFAFKEADWTRLGHTSIVETTYAVAYRQLPAAAYTTGCVHGLYATGASWPGVECCVSDAVDRVAIRVHPNAPEYAGNGRCVLPKTGGTLTVDHLSLDRP